MNERIQQFLLAENISQAQFADSIGVARAGISHILAGRNKPSLDFIERTVEKYPNLNLDWLITGKGKMYRTSAAVDPSETNSPIYSDDLFKQDANTVFNEEQTPSTPDSKQRQGAEINDAMQEACEKSNSQRHIEKIIVFYSDKTFEEVK